MSHSLRLHRFTLDNGMRVVVNHDPHSAMAVVNLLYNTGSRDENRQRTGIAHLFEHLMFGGSANVADFDDALEIAGGTSNAWTSNDFTNFYQTLPAANIETALYLESDRMRSLDFSQRSLQIQQGVVIEEFKQTCLNRPYGDIWHRLRNLAYSKDHPYSWPTLGLIPQHIADMSLADIKNWFYAHYAPNNAILSIVGGIPPEKAEKLVAKWFGPIPPRDINKRVLPDVGFPTQSKEEIVRAAVPDVQIVMAYPMDKYGTKRYFAADTISDLLSVGRSSRFYKNLIKGEGSGLFANADASILGSEHEGLLLLNATINSKNDTDIAKAKYLLNKTAESLFTQELSQYELERSLNNFETSFLLDNMQPENRAANIALAEYHNEDINSTISSRRQLTVSDVKHESVKLFQDTPSASIIYIPE